MCHGLFIVWAHVFTMYIHCNCFIYGDLLQYVFSIVLNVVIWCTQMYAVVLLPAVCIILSDHWLTSPQQRFMCCMITVCSVFCVVWLLSAVFFVLCDDCLQCSQKLYKRAILLQAYQLSSYYIKIETKVGWLEWWPFSEILFILR